MPEDLPVKPALLTVRQVAFIIQVHPNTVLNYTAQGKLKAHNPSGNGKGLRITVESVKVYLQKYLLESFDEKTFEDSIQTAVLPPEPKPRPRTRGWVKNWL